MKPRVLVSIVTYNSGFYLARCLEALREQTYRDVITCLWDNASQDDSIEIAAASGDLLHSSHFSTRNVGFCAAHNRLISATDSEYVLVLNPDVYLESKYIESLVEALENDPASGAATGKLWRWTGDKEEKQDPKPSAKPSTNTGLSDTPSLSGQTRPKILDTTGIYFTRNQRHLDRGSGERDVGQCERCEYVFGASGAAAFYRRKMLEEIKIEEEYFDESFFAYREDADLAWRAQWMGWRCLYVPAATAYHARKVLPERRASLPPAINMHSLKNRFLLRIKNMDLGTYGRNFLPITFRDLTALAYVVLRERSSFRAFPLLFKALPAAWAARKALQRHRRTSPAELRSWFSNQPVSKPVPPKQIDRSY